MTPGYQSTLTRMCSSLFVTYYVAFLSIPRRNLEASALTGRGLRPDTDVRAFPPLEPRIGARASQDRIARTRRARAVPDLERRPYLAT